MVNQDNQVSQDNRANLASQDNQDSRDNQAILVSQDNPLSNLGNRDSQDNQANLDNPTNQVSQKRNQAQETILLSSRLSFFFILPLILKLNQFYSHSNLLCEQWLLVTGNWIDLYVLK